MERKVSGPVLIWLCTGFVMVFIQIILGAVTRLTGSGLSITHWDIITGVVFPINETSWLREFGMYKQTPQYLKINEGMSLAQFKFIYFWEYIHRLWARFMGFIFLIPFIYFVVNKKISSWLIKDLILVILLAIFVASLGWIMVASGLIERPWVNAYKLSFHLSAAIVLLSFLFWIVLKASSNKFSNFYWTKNSTLSVFISSIIFLQLFLGGVMSGMKAGLVAPSWPDINGYFIPLEIGSISNLLEELFGNYENNAISGIVIQFFHRMWAYFIFIVIALCTYYFYFIKEYLFFKFFRNLLLLISLQIVLGIYTVLSCVGSIPLALGVIHQFFGIASLLFSLLILFNSTRIRIHQYKQ
ncbi:MAG: COX15/CtaA family protein [Saprospiraceae bacterium]